MAIDSVVIRYHPYDPFAGSYAMGVTVNEVNFSGLATAFYSGYAAYTSSTFIGYPYVGGGGFISTMDMDAAGLTGATREWAFVTLAPDGTTLAPVDEDTSEILVGFTQCYAGGVVEIGAYIDGAFVLLGSGSFSSFSDGGDYTGSMSIDLTWPAVPPFWTSKRNTVEIV